MNDKLSLTAIFNTSYLQPNGHDRKHETAAGVHTGWKTDSNNVVTYSSANTFYKKQGYYGTWAYYATLSADYAVNNIVTAEVQAAFENTSVFATSKSKGGKEHSDALAKSRLYVRPGVIVTPEKNCTLSAGLLFDTVGFSTNANLKHSTIATTVSLPVILRVKL